MKSAPVSNEAIPRTRKFSNLIIDYGEFTAPENDRGNHKMFANTHKSK
jgi:hypothetical protein